MKQKFWSIHLPLAESSWGKELKCLFLFEMKWAKFKEVFGT